MSGMVPSGEFLCNGIGRSLRIGNIEGEGSTLGKAQRQQPRLYTAEQALLGPGAVVVLYHSSSPSFLKACIHRTSMPDSGVPSLIRPSNREPPLCQARAQSGRRLPLSSGVPSWDREATH